MISKRLSILIINFLLIGLSLAVIPITTINSNIGGRPFSNIRCSENVNVYLQKGFNPTTTISRTNCPYSWFTYTQVARLSHGSNLTIANGVKALFTTNSVPLDAQAVVNRILVQRGGMLVFNETDMTLNVREIFVEDGGSLYIGTQTCRFQKNLKILFFGDKANSSLTGFSSTGPTSKGLISFGQVDIHGKLYTPTWSRLSLTARAGDNIIFLGDNVNWEIGQQIVVVTSAYYDCPPQFQKDFCSDTPHQNEVRTIVDIYSNCTSGVFAIQLDSPLTYLHYSGPEYQTEVALLSRNVILASGGPITSDGFGGHTAVVGVNATGRFSGVKAHQLGQLNVMGRYPFHFHLMANQGNTSFFQDCVVTNSFFRAFVVHGTNSSRISRNVAYDVQGFAYYLEDGVEEKNTFEYNLAAYISPIFRPAEGGWGQEGETFSASASLIVPADTSASGFYISNAYNSFLGNAASGGWSGFAFPNIPLPLGVYQGKNYGNNNPWNRPILSFLGNTAHSTGFYWRAHGTAIYTGAYLRYENNVLTYTSGRYGRNTYLTNTNQPTTMLFNHTKVWGTTKGFAHWGNNAELYNFEAHDIMNGAMLFGSSMIQNAIINSRTNNRVAWETYLIASRTKWNKGLKFGFQFYDTWTQTILSRVTFKNFNAPGEFAVRSTDHSDQFLPQGINGLRGIKYVNMNRTQIMNITHCGPACGETELTSSMASRIYSYWDFDGTFTTSNKPSIVGSGRNWWNVGSDCEFVADYGQWRCNWTTNRQIVYIPLKVPGLMEGCDSTVAFCSSQKANYTVGKVTQWGPNFYGINMSPWPGVAGISNTGWYWRTQQSNLGIDGAPSTFLVNDAYQIPRNNFVVVAVRYPSTATFKVSLLYRWNSIYFNLPMTTKDRVLAKNETLLNEAAFTGCDIPGYRTDGSTDWIKLCSGSGGIGPAWHFDGTYLYLRVVDAACYTTYGKSDCQYKSTYTRDGVSIWDIESGYRYIVEVTSCAGCTVQKTYKGVNYYQVTDSPPASFGAVAGSLRSKPTVNYATSRVCPNTNTGCGQ